MLHLSETVDGITYNLIKLDKHTGLEIHTLISKDPDFGIFYYHQSGNAVPTTTLDTYCVPYRRRQQQMATEQN